MYESEDQKWMVRRGEYTQLFQIITVSKDTIKYGAYTPTGKLYDAFDLIKKNGKKRLINKIPDSPVRLKKDFVKGGRTKFRPVSPSKGLLGFRPTRISPRSSKPYSPLLGEAHVLKIRKQFFGKSVCMTLLYTCSRSRSNPVSSFCFSISSYLPKALIHTLEPEATIFRMVLLL